jgi:hypothetical protein
MTMAPVSAAILHEPQRRSAVVLVRHLDAAEDAQRTR